MKAVVRTGTPSSASKDTPREKGSDDDIGKAVTNVKTDEELRTEAIDRYPEIKRNVPYDDN